MNPCSKEPHLIVKPIRVLHVFGNLDKGGAETRTMEIYRAIDKSKIQFDFIVHTKNIGAFESEIRSLGGKVFHSIPRYKIFNFISYLKSWNEFFEENKYTIIHINTTNSAWAILRCAINHNVRMRISHARSAGQANFLRKLHVLLFKSTLRHKSTHKFAVSELAGDFYFGSTYEIIPDAIAASKYQFNINIRQNLRSSLGLCSSFVIGHVGRFHKCKNHFFMLDVFAKTIKKIPNAKLVLIGDGELKEEIKHKINELNLNSAVMLLGLRDDVPALMQALDCLLLPSLYEGLPGVALEGQAACLPCILSNTITQEVAAVAGLALFLPIDLGSDCWASAIEKIFTNPPPRYNTYEEIKKAGFDVRFRSKWFENLYLS